MGGLDKDSSLPPSTNRWLELTPPHPSQRAQPSQGIASPNPSGSSTLSNTEDSSVAQTSQENVVSVNSSTASSVEESSGSQGVQSASGEISPNTSLASITEESFASHGQVGSEDETEVASDSSSISGMSAAGSNLSHSAGSDYTVPPETNDRVTSPTESLAIHEQWEENLNIRHLPLYFHAEALSPTGYHTSSDNYTAAYDSDDQGGNHFARSPAIGNNNIHNGYTSDSSDEVSVEHIEDIYAIDSSDDVHVEDINAIDTTALYNSVRHDNRAYNAVYGGRHENETQGEYLLGLFLFLVIGIEFSEYIMKFARAVRNGQNTLDGGRARLPQFPTTEASDRARRMAIAQRRHEETQAALIEMYGNFDQTMRRIAEERAAAAAANANGSGSTSGGSDIYASAESHGDDSSTSSVLGGAGIPDSDNEELESGSEDNGGGSDADDEKSETNGHEDADDELSFSDEERLNDLFPEGNHDADYDANSGYEEDDEMSDDEEQDSSTAAGAA